MSAKFESRDDLLFIDGKEMIRGWESFTGWFWFAVDEARIQDSVIGGKVYEDDVIWFGYVQGLEEEWGYFSQAEIESLGPKTWEIPKESLSWSGRRA